jgi:hypothetical protein
VAGSCDEPSGSGATELVKCSVKRANYEVLRIQGVKFTHSNTHARTEGVTFDASQQHVMLERLEKHGTVH